MYSSDGSKVHLYYRNIHICSLEREHKRETIANEIRSTPMEWRYFYHFVAFWNHIFTKWNLSWMKQYQWKLPGAQGEGRKWISALKLVGDIYLGTVVKDNDARTVHYWWSGSGRCPAHAADQQLLEPRLNIINSAAALPQKVARHAQSGTVLAVLLCGIARDLLSPGWIRTSQQSIAVIMGVYLGARPCSRVQFPGHPIISRGLYGGCCHSDVATRALFY